MVLNRYTIISVILFMTILLSYVNCDSAGHISPPAGLAFGGIPYGSISGQVADYFKQNPQVNSYNEPPAQYDGVVERLPSFEDNLIDD